MRGEVLSFDPASGAGWISGADGVRYSFTTADLAAPVPVQPGAVLEFTPVGAVATGVMPAATEAGPQGFGGTATPFAGLFSPVSPDVVGEPDMSIWAFAKRCARKYADFNGRARRKEYWSFTLVRTLVVLPFYIAAIALLITAGALSPEGSGATSAGPAATAAVLGAIACFGICLLVILAELIPAYAVLARRFHDVGLSAWWMLLAFVPGVGFLVLVVAFMPSQAGANIYGRYPKPVTSGLPLR